MLTLFEYLYRDAGNFKAFGSVALEGALSEEELERIRGLFDGDGWFIAEQLGVPPLYQHLYQWSGGPIQSDHCWHEFLKIRVVGDSEVPPEAERSGSAQKFLEALLAIGSWDEARSHTSALICGHNPPPSPSLATASESRAQNRRSVPPLSSRSPQDNRPAARQSPG
jgi:hypothetical protein